ncbi:MAG: hypothetical protein ACRD0K_21395 [Egibacteraceae bacterium]
MWSGLVEHLFDKLASASGDDRASDTHEPDPARADQITLCDRLTEAEEKRQRLDRKLRKLATAPSVAERMARLDSLRALGSELWHDVRSHRRSLARIAVIIVVLLAIVVASAALDTEGACRGSPPHWRQQ